MSEPLKIQINPEPVPAVKPPEQTPPPVVPPVTPPVDPANPIPPAAPVDQTKPNIAIDKYEAEFAKDGKLSDESYTALAAAGLPKETVDKYIAAQQTAAAGAELQAEQNRQTVFGLVGGQESYQTIVQWAAAKLPANEQAAFNATMETNNVEQIKLAVSGLKAKFDAEYGRDPKLVGGSAAPAGPATFESMAQVTAAMRDPRYAKDPAYRAEVLRRLERF